MTEREGGGGAPRRRRRRRSGGNRQRSGQSNQQQRGGRNRRGRRSSGQGGGGGGGRAGFVDAPPQGEPTVEVKGVLQVAQQGHGHLRTAAENYNPEPTDPIVPRQLIQEMNLETGVEIGGMAVEPTRPGQGPVVTKIDTLNGGDLEAWGERRVFKNLVAESPTERIHPSSASPTASRPGSST